MAIMKMKCVTFVTLAKEGEALLRRLQELGVLHPEHIEAPRENEIVDHLEHELHVQRQVIRELEGMATGDRCELDQRLSKEVTFDSLEGWISDKKSVTEKLSRIGASIEKQRDLGDFDPWSLKKLGEQGISIGLWTCDRKIMKSNALPEGVMVREIFVSGKDVCFAVVAKGDPIVIDWAQEVEMPSRSLASLQKEKEELSHELCELDLRLERSALQLPRFTAETRDTFK